MNIVKIHAELNSPFPSMTQKTKIMIAKMMFKVQMARKLFPGKAYELR